MRVPGRLRRTYLKALALLGRKEAYARGMGVEIGQDCRILTHSFGSEPFLIRLGDRVTLSREVLFLNHDGSSWLMRDEKGRRESFGRIEIGNDVFVGARAILLPGVVIGDRVVVGAGSVVTRSIPSGLVVAGNPARAIGSFDDLRVRILASCKAHAELPSRDELVDFALAALMPARPPLQAPQHRERQVRS